MKAQAELARIVRFADPDRYLSVLYAPSEKRAALLALYAFDAEISTIRDRIREPLPGEIRLQWWRNTIMASVPVGHPVADALVGAIREHRLPSAIFDSLLEARVFDLYDDPMPNRSDLEAYLGDTEGAIMRLASRALSPGEATAGSDAISNHAGSARGLAKILLRLPSDMARGRCFVPRDVLDAVGASAESFGGNQPYPARAGAVEAMLALAREHFGLFTALAVELPPTVRPALLPLAVLPDTFRALEDSEKVLAGTIASVPAWRRHWLMLKCATQGWPRK